MRETSNTCLPQYDRTKDSNPSKCKLPEDILVGKEPWDKKPMSIEEFVLAEYGATLLARMEMSYQDTKRLEFLYSPGRPSSKELIDIEFKLFNNTEVPMSEVRVAIDQAMKEAE